MRAFIVREYNAKGEQIDRDATLEEIADRKARALEYDTRADEIAAAEKAKSDQRMADLNVVQEALPTAAVRKAMARLFGLG